MLYRYSALERLEGVHPLAFQNYLDIPIPLFPSPHGSLPAPHLEKSDATPGFVATTLCIHTWMMPL